MSTTAERSANDLALQDVVDLAANGDQDAAQYLGMMAYVARVLDDLWDHDRQIESPELARIAHILLVDLHRQPFFQAHRLLLVGAHQIALNAWLDANEMEQHPTPINRVYAHVLRDTINELAPTVAYLTGGYEHARHTSRVMREKFAKEL
jgi:hypothetical protein